MRTYGADHESNSGSRNEGDNDDDDEVEADAVEAELEDSTASSDADPGFGAAVGWEAAWASGRVGVDRRGEELATRTGCWQLRALRLESCGGDDVPAFFAALVTTVPGLRRLALTFPTEHSAGDKSALIKSFYYEVSIYRCFITFFISCLSVGRQGCTY